MNSGSRLAICATLILVALAGCGSDKKSDGAGSSTVPAAQATVSTADVSGFGTVLTNRAGKPFYVLTSDPTGGSKCTGSCAKSFPPVLADGTPSAGPGTKPELLKTFSRSGGGTQVSYGGHALYTYKGKGLVSGAGKKAKGGTWYLVSPKGEPIKFTTAGGY